MATATLQQQQREFWKHNFHPITGKKENLRGASRSIRVDLTARRVAVVNNFKNMQI